MTNFTKVCVTDLVFLEQSFVLIEEQKKAKIIIWTNHMAEDMQLQIETPADIVNLMKNWTDEECC